MNYIEQIARLEKQIEHVQTLIDAGGEHREFHEKCKAFWRAEQAKFAEIDASKNKF